MQLQSINRGVRRTINPKRMAKARGQSSNKNAIASRSYENVTRSFRQTAGNETGRRSKKDNRGASGLVSANPANKRRSPVGAGRNTQAKRRAPQGAQRAKELKGMSTGRAKPSGGAKGSSAKRARSRR
jgi:hypothetical protein